MTQTVLTATIPTTRQDNSALDPTAIASITYQKTAAGVQTPINVLQTNNAQSGQGLLPTDLTYTDTTAAVGDSYTFFVTDTAGNTGAVSNTFVNSASGGGVSPPAAGTLSGVFTP